jgi:NitT/TauT family transport system permease protein
MKILFGAFSKSFAIIVFILIWEITCRLGLFHKMLIPPFSDVIIKTWEMFQNGYMTEHLLISLFRASSGFIIAVIIAIPLGFLLGGWFRYINLTLDSLFEVLSQTNPFLLFHIIIIFLGIGELPKVFIITWACIWPIMFNTIYGIKNINPVIIKAGRGFGLRRVKLFWKIVFPSVTPSIFTGIRISAGYSLFMLIAAEMMGASKGLGWLISASEENYDVLTIFSSVLVIAFIGLAFDETLRLIQKKFFIRTGEDILNSEY